MKYFCETREMTAARAFPIGDAIPPHRRNSRSRCSLSSAESQALELKFLQAIRIRQREFGVCWPFEAEHPASLRQCLNGDPPCGNRFRLV